MKRPQPADLHQNTRHRFHRHSNQDTVALYTNNIEFTVDTRQDPVFCTTFTDFATSSWISCANWLWSPRRTIRAEATILLLLCFFTFLFYFFSIHFLRRIRADFFPETLPYGVAASAFGFSRDWGKNYHFPDFSRQGFQLTLCRSETQSKLKIP